MHWLVILSALISVFGAVAYIRDTLAGRSKPNRVSWIVWAAAPILGTVAALAAGADIWVTIRVFLAGFVPLLVFLASFVNPKAYWKITKFDIAFGIIAVIGLGFWIFADSPQMAVLFLAIADGAAAIPTLAKAWKFPETETGFTYVMGLIAVLLVLPSIEVWNIENSAFQIYLLLVTSALIFCVYRKRILGFFTGSGNFHT